MSIWGGRKAAELRLKHAKRAVKVLRTVKATMWRLMKLRFGESREATGLRYHGQRSTVYGQTKFAGRREKQQFLSGGSFRFR